VGGRGGKGRTRTGREGWEWGGRESKREGETGSTFTHSVGGDTNRRSCMGWRLNVCITIVSRSGADSHQKITYVAVLCLLSCAFNCAIVS